MSQKKFSRNVRAIAMTAMLSALATVLMLLEFPLPFLTPTFIKMDLSELSALIASFAIGPWSGIAVCLIKNLINLPFTYSGGVGELANFLLGCAMVVPAGLIYRRKKTRRRALIGGLVGSATMALLSFPINLFLVYPIYSKLIMPIDTIIETYRAVFPFVDSLWMCLLVSNLSFTLLKGLLDVAVTFPIYKPLSGFIKGRTR